MFRVFSDIAGYNTTTILGSGWFLEKTLIFGSLPPKREMIFNIYMRKKRYPKILDHIIQRPYSTRTRPATRYFFQYPSLPDIEKPYLLGTGHLAIMLYHAIPWHEMNWHDMTTCGAYLCPVGSIWPSLSLKCISVFSAQIFSFQNLKNTPCKHRSGWLNSPLAQALKPDFSVLYK